MLAQMDHFFRRVRRRLSRSDQAIRRLGLPVSEGTGNEPGLVLIQIDGLSRTQMERAVERGRMPFLRQLMQREEYRLRTFHPGLPSSTPAVQAELHYGARCAVPAFSFFDRARRKVFTMLTPECAKEVEDRLRESGEGLLRGGSSWCNIYTGGADDEESHFCPASMGLRNWLRARPFLRTLTLPIFHLPSALKLLGLLVIEFFIATGDVIAGLARGRNWLEEFKGVFKRVILCIAVRELISIGVKIDVSRGLPVIHANFMGYDTQAHRRGPASAYAHWSLAGIDRAIKNIHRAAHRSGRRHYQLWVFSDHGQEATFHFDELRPAGLEAVVSNALGLTQPADASVRKPDMAALLARSTGGHAASRGLDEWIRTEVLALFEERRFTITAMGPVAHLYLKKPPTVPEKRRLAEVLVRQGSIPGVLLRDESDAVEWIHANGRVDVSDSDALDSLSEPGWACKDLSADLTRLCRHEFAGDLVLLGWGPNGVSLSFANERGSHAGPGPEETRGFALLPHDTRLPDGVDEVLRPSDLRAAVLHYLGRSDIGSTKAPSVVRRDTSPRQLRVMTYNIHGCLGMDGRTSTARIARLIGRYQPDFVALQEVDLGRARSHRVDQARHIAEALGLHYAFCPTVVRDGEQYGHALLGALPFEVVRRDVLTDGGESPRVEPRGALWVRVETAEGCLNVMNTHFGLGRGERLRQAATLLGDDWIGAVDPDEPLIVCGDFNTLPRGAAYRALAGRLKDVQTGFPPLTPPRNTFSSLQPLVRIDHIFASSHFKTANIIVPRNQITRVASDHLPLIADLALYDGES